MDFPPSNNLFQGAEIPYDFSGVIPRGHLTSCVFLWSSAQLDNERCYACFRFFPSALPFLPPSDWPGIAWSQALPSTEPGWRYKTRLLDAKVFVYWVTNQNIIQTALAFLIEKFTDFDAANYLLYFNVLM